MPATKAYADLEPPRAEIDNLHGTTVLEFGAPWCGHCNAAQPLIEAVLADAASVNHIKVEDGKGRPLGRSFRVTLWPTLIFLRNGKEITRLVRPTSANAIRDAFLEAQ